MKQAFIRLAVAVILFVNAILTSKGLNPIPFDENLFAEILSNIIAGLGVLWVWWKNNSVTHEARLADEYMHSLKDAKNDRGGENDSDTEEDHSANEPSDAEV